jgi:hypothetical protein
MPVQTESLYQSFGGTRFPTTAADVTDTLVSLDPGRDLLLELFASAINSELGEVWTTVTGTMGSDHKFAGTSPVQSTLPEEPTKQNLTSVKKNFPLLALHRDPEEETKWEPYTLEVDKLTQQWKLHYILGPLDIIDQRKLKDIGQAVAKIVKLVIKKRGHPSYQSGALQFFDDTSRFARVDMVSSKGPTQAGFGEGADTTVYWAMLIKLETEELSSFIEGSLGPVDAADITIGIGGGEGILPDGIQAQTDAQNF